MADGQGPRKLLADGQSPDKLLANGQSPGKLLANGQSPGKLLAVGLTAGLVVGLLGGGASTVVVPGLTLWLRVREHIAHGSTCAVVLPTALIGAWLYARQGHVAWTLALPLALGGAGGAYLGTLLMARLPAHWLRRLFGVTALLAGWQMLFP